MDVTQLYAIVAGGLFALLTVLNFCFRLWKITQKCSAVVLRYIVYPLFLRRHRLMGPWSRSGFLLRFAYIAANIFCSGFRIVSVPEASNRTGTLSLINMLPLFLGPHLSFLAVMMGLSLHNFQAVHGSSAFVSVLLSAAHTGLGLSGSGAYSFHEPSHLYGLIGVCALAALLLFSPRCFRRPSYELFLRAHQGCAALAAYAIWRHITKRSTFPGICLYIAPGLFLLTTLAEGLVAVYRNFTLRRGYSRASVSKLRGAIRMRIDVPRSWSIRAGQYVNVWFPGVGFRAWLETHPFMIVSWTTNTEWSSSDSETATLMSWTAEKGNSFDPETATLGSRTVGKKGGPSGEKGSSFNPEGATLRSWAARKRPRSQLTTIQLLIDPRDGFTRRLLRHAETTRDTRKRLVLYSGPHGSPASMKEYGSVLMIASGFGIAAHLPYIKELLDGSQACQIVTRRIHLVWQLREQGDEMVAKDLIDDLLVKDSENFGWMLQISIYYSGSHEQRTEVEGAHGRLAHHDGTFDAERILMAEVNGDYDRYIDGEKQRWTGQERGDILVAVSAHGQLRDDMRTLVEAGLDQGVRFLELEYQPQS